VAETEEEPQFIAYDVVETDASGIQRTRVRPSSYELSNAIRHVVYTIGALQRKGIQHLIQR
jgi:hypothetical protein